MTAPLTFRHEKLKVLLKRTIPQWRKGLLPSFGDDIEGSPKAGFWIVGDQGVYLMGNGVSHKTRGGRQQPVVYAEECDPTTMPFDDWWAYKNASFGGDDGAEFIPRKQVEDAVAIKHDLVVEFSVEQMVILHRPK